jgi:hypothetical protein
MPRIVGDAELLGKLLGGEKTVEVCDEGGRVMGRYLPESDYLRLLAQNETFRPLSEDDRREAIEAMKAGKCKTTEELRADLANIREFWKKPS